MPPGCIIWNQWFEATIKCIIILQMDAEEECSFLLCCYSSVLPPQPHSAYRNIPVGSLRIKQALGTIAIEILLSWRRNSWWTEAMTIAARRWRWFPTILKLHASRIDPLETPDSSATLSPSLSLFLSVSPFARIPVLQLPWKTSTELQNHSVTRHRG